MASTELEQKPGQAIDPEQEPSVDWGWHASFPKGRQIAGWFSVFALLVMLIGNHQGILSGGSEFKIEDVWLVIIAVGVAIGLIADLRKRKMSWRG